MKFPDDTNTFHKIYFIGFVGKKENIFVKDLLEHCMMISATREEIITTVDYTRSKDLVDYILTIESSPNKGNPS